MKIAIDVSPVIYGTGVSVYIKSLVENLISLDTTNNYVLFGGSLRRTAELTSFIKSLNSARLEARVYPLAPKLLDFVWNRLHVLGIENLVGDIDVYHSSDWTQAPSRAFKVTTIHDLVPFFYPEASHPKIIAAHTRRLQWVKREADRVIVPSLTTAEDAKRFGISEKKIRIIPEAIDISFKAVSALKVTKVKKFLGIGKKYLLAVGTAHRKNIAGIVAAFRLVKKDTDLMLVIAGEHPESYKSEKDILFTGYLDEKDKPALYTGSEAFLYPSFYEGFGLPILEAYSCKTPVVTSNFGSMKEISGNASVLVDPANVESIARGIFKAIKERKSLIKKGDIRLKNYSWKKSAEETLKVYKERK